MSALSCWRQLKLVMSNLRIMARVSEVLSDPDPNARAAGLEAILDSGDATRIQMALRLAFQSDDSNLRALALRACGVQVPPLSLLLFMHALARIA